MSNNNKYEKSQALYDNDYHCVCCKEDNQKLLVLRIINETKFILCRSCNELYRRNKILRLRNRFIALKTHYLMNKREVEFRKILGIK